MPCSNSVEVKITTFINPHLFWIFEKENVGKRADLESRLSGTVPVVINKPQLEQFVLVRNTKFKRAVIKDIAPDKYYCWLIDYGVLYNADKVYKVPNGLTKAGPLVKQAALDNVVCAKEVLGPMGKSLVESMQFTPGTIQFAKEHIKSASTIFFQCVRERDNIHIGAINIRSRNGDQYDLSSLLIKEKLLVFNTQMFLQALDLNSNDDDENYLKYLRTVSPQSSSLVDSSSKEESVSYRVSKSVGRAKSRRSPLKSSNTEINKHKDLEKWVEQAKTTTSVVESSESDGESKSDLKVENLSKTDSELDPGDSVSVTTKLSPSTLEKLREIKNRHFSKNASRPGQVFLDKTTDRSTDVSVNISVDSDSLSCSSIEAPQLCLPPLEQSKTETSASKNINSDSSPKNKILSWGDFDDGVSEKPPKRSITSSLNIQPAGASYSSQVIKKAVSKTSVKKSSASVVSNAESTYSSHSVQKNSSNEPIKKNKPSLTSSAFNGDFNHIIDGAENDVMDVMHNINPDILCMCSQCKKWTTEALHAPEISCKKDPVQPRKLVKAPLLLKTEEDKNDEVVIKTTSPEMKYRTQIMTDPNIIVHGTIFPKPAQSVSEVPFSPEIHRALYKFEQVYSIQSYAWPCLLRKMNVCLVNTSKTGKTMGYLPVMCTYLLERDERYNDLPTNTISPIVIILCPGTLVADEVYDLTVQLMKEASDRPSIALAIPPMDKSCMNQFQRQCDLLITTPIMLLNLLHSRIITTKRVCHLVLECTDVILEKFSKEMDKVLNLINTMLMHRNSNHSVQLVTLSELWTMPLENLIKQIRYTPLVCIGAYLEAALYGRVDIQMCFLESHIKKLKLYDLLKNEYKTCRTIVICNNDDQVEEIKETLELKGIKGAFVNGKMEKVEIEETEEKWLATVGGKHLVFVCTDEIYHTIIRINNAVLLIQYSLPATWTQFSSRFSCFLKNYISPLSTIKQDNWIRCKSHIFLDETCTKQFPKLIQFLTRMGCQLTTKFKEYYEASLKTKEDRNISLKVELCPTLKQFGKCTNLKCKRRHALSLELDYSNSRPKNGTIKFKILKIRNVTLYTVKLLEHTDLDGNKHDCDEYPNLQKDLQEAMLEEKYGVYDAQLNKMYSFYFNVDQLYHRCITKKIVHRERITNKATSVILKLIDDGLDVVTGVADLYELPEMFKKIPAQSVEVRLANYVPPDSDDHFSTYSKNKVKTLINKAKDETSYCSGLILLQLSNTFWIKNMCVMEYLPTVNTTATKLNLSKDLLKQNIANKSEAPLLGLYRLCENAGIELPNTTRPKVIKDAVFEQIEPQWAFLDETEYSEVYMITVQTPSLFYVRIKKYHNLLLDLEKEIQEVILRPLHPTNFQVHVGQYYLAKDPGGDDFCRVKVTDIKDGIASCFYVDYGDLGNVDVASIKFLPNEFIERLPFQAIECRLYGVEPLFEAWEPEAIAIIDRYIFEPETDYFRTLYATTCKTETSVTTGGQKYAILLIDSFTKKNTVINKLLIDCGEAINIRGENIDIEFIRPDSKVEDIEVVDIFEDVEDKELTFEDVHRIKSKYGVENNEKVNGYDDTDNVWDFELNNPERFIQNLLGVTQKPTAQVNEDAFLAPLRALPSPGYSTPNIEWFQNETNVKLTILLPDLNQYNLHLVRNTSLIFKAFCNETHYQFHLQLYNKVHTMQESPSGLCLKITLNKLQPGIWPRLTLCKERLRFIKYDLKQCIEPEEPKKPILSLGQVLEEGDGVPGDTIIEYGSDGESSSDESISSGDW